jgi:predicted PurR-regulated permease PerM
MPTQNHPWRDGIRLFFVTLILLGLAIHLFDVLLLFFAAALLGVLFRAPSEWLSARTSLDVRIALGIVLVVVVALLAVCGWLLGHTILQQIGGVSSRLPEAIESLRDRLSEIAFMRPVVENTSLEASGSDLADRGIQTLAATLSAVASVGLVVFVAVLFAAQPDTYVRGALHLLPKRHRARAQEVFGELGHVLRRWLLGQLCLMVLVGTLTFLGFWAIGMEFAGALGLLAGALTFIPFLGSLIAGVIAVLVALTQGPTVALYAAAVYVGVQIIENVCEPLVQQRAVYLAPALLLFAQVVLGILAGAVGTIVATPLAAAIIVVIKMLYVEDALGDRNVRTTP